MNKLGYIISGIAYLLLALAYVFRGKIQVGNTVYKVAHREMQLVVSILYLTLGYVYIVDGVYDQFEDAFEEEKEEEKEKEQKKKEHTYKYLKIISLYVILAVIVYYYGKKMIATEEH